MQSMWRTLTPVNPYAKCSLEGTKEVLEQGSFMTRVSTQTLVSELAPKYKDKNWSDMRK